MVIVALMIAAPFATSPRRAGAATTVRLDAAIGFEGFARPGTPTPLRVLVEADGFFAGTLRIEVLGSHGPIAVQRRLEIPGGSRKQFDLLLPHPDVQGIQVLDRSGRVAGRASASVSGLAAGEPLIGVVSVAPPPLTHVDIPFVGHSARVAAIPGRILDLGADGLRGLSHLVVDGAAIPALSPRQIEAILGFAELGGELVVAARSDAALSFLPAAWRGIGRGAIRRTNAGAGSVTVALTPFSDGAWSDTGSMWRRAVRASDVARWSGDDLRTTDWLEALSASGRFRRGTLGWLLTFVLTYVALVGPVNFIVLGRLKRRDLAWITIPALALLFAGGAYVAGHNARNVPIVQGVGMKVVDASGERDVVAVGVLSRSGGVKHIRFPASWIAEPIGGFGSAGEQPVVEPNRDGSDVTFRLSVGAFGTAVGSRVEVGTRSTAGTLRIAAGMYRGTVKNPTSVRLRDAAVLAGNSYESLGTMEPGESRAISLNERRGAGVPIEQHFFEGGGDPTTFQGVFALVQRAKVSHGLGDPGRAFLMGVAELEDVSASLGLGKTIGTMVVLAPIGLKYPASGQIPNSAIRRSVIATDGRINASFGPFVAVEDAKRSILRFELPSRDAKRFTLSSGRLDQFGMGPFRKFVPGPDGGPVLIGPDGGPVAVPGSGEKGATVAIYDFTRRSWRTVAFAKGSASFTRNVSSYVSPDGEVIVRITSDFAQVFAPASLELSGVFA